MIVGGGDLSIADEALKHKGVKEVVLVDIDGRVVELCREHFGEINAKAFKDKRLKIEIADAFEYLGRPESKGRFDLIVADRPDPVGPGKALFGETFYDRVKGALKPGGFATFQTGVPFYQPWEITEALKELRAVLPAIGSLSHRRADLYRRLHGALLGRQGQASSARRPASRKAAAAFKTSTAQDRLLQRRDPRRGVRAAGMDQAAGALSVALSPRRGARGGALRAAARHSASPGRPTSTRRCSPSRRRPRSMTSQPGGHTKNLFLKDKKDGLWLVVAARRSARRPERAVEAARRAALLLRLGGASDRRRSASTPGSVTPFALMNDTRAQGPRRARRRRCWRSSRSTSTRCATTARQPSPPPIYSSSSRACGHEPRHRDSAGARHDARRRRLGRARSPAASSRWSRSKSATSTDC